MSETQPILDLLQEKKALFLEFERASEAMCFCPADEMEGHMAERLRLQEKIQQADDQLLPLLREVPGAAEAASHQADRDSLGAGLAEIYDAAMSVRGVVNRILLNEPTLIERVKLERESLLKKLEETRKSSSSVANSYYKTMSTGRRPYLGEKVTKA